MEGKGLLLIAITNTGRRTCRSGLFISDPWEDIHRQPKAGQDGT